MDNNSNDSILMAIAVVAVLGAIFLAAMVIGAPRSDFDRPMNIASFEQALASKGLHVCEESDINWTTTPGFVSGKLYDVSTNCSSHDPNKPGARVWVAKFKSVEARDAAMRNFETGRRSIGPGMAWSNGPLAIFVDGNRKSEVASVLQEAVASLGAQKGRG
jgi:hypothetical protein